MIKLSVVSKTLSLIDPSAALTAFAHEKNVFCLQSSVPSERGRFSFIGFDPFAWTGAGGEKGWRGLRKDFRRYRCAPSPLTPFPCGIMGALSYELGGAFEKIPLRKKTGSSVLDVVFGFYDTVITVDHKLKKTVITSVGDPSKPPAARRRDAFNKIEKITRRLQDVTFSAELPLIHVPSVTLTTMPNKTRYKAAVRKALDYIREGDIYQVNLSRACAASLGGIPPEILGPVLFSLLRKFSPASFSAYFDAGDLKIVSSSPERFLKVSGDHVETRPMKGTRPRARGRSDASQRRELLNSAKDRAELLMITDLLRNDIGRVCRFGSVKVRHMRSLEKYKTVYQTTSTVEGRLRPDKDMFDLVRASFPGGSITGCPKIRSMRIIDELEPFRRGMYTGALGYMSFSGSMDLNILIRSMFLRRDRLSFHVGGAIVADSKPEAEYRETVVKARGMQQTLDHLSRKPSGGSWISLDGKTALVNASFLSSLTPGVFVREGIFETMLFSGGQAVFFDSHMERLRRSLKTLGIPFSVGKNQIRRAIADLVRRNKLRRARVRLAVWKDSRTRFYIVVLPSRPAVKQYRQGIRAVVYDERLDEKARFANLKQLDYRFFRRAAAFARHRRADEALIRNRSGKLAEGSRSNLFVIRDGRLLTPPLSAGCLDGVTRQRVALMARDAGMKVLPRGLTLRDLQTADEAFLTNSLWGVMPLVRIGRRPIGRGRPGPRTEKLVHFYHKSL